MPVGPSHRRGGSSRSSSSFSRSSGSRSSSSSYRSSSSRSYSSGHRRSYSRSYYDYDDYGSVSIHMSPRGWAIFGLIWGFVLALVFMISGVNTISENLPYRRIMKQDAEEYQEIIDKAHNGEDGYYIIDINDIEVSEYSNYYGEYTYYNDEQDFFAESYFEVEKDGVNYYYLDFEFTDDMGHYVSGTTYTYYSEAAVASLSSLTFVYTKEYDNDGSWDIIQDGYQLEKNIDYWYTGKQVTTGAIVFVLGIGLTALFIWCCTLVHKAKKKAEATSTSTTEGSSTTTTAPTQKYKYCKYCGCQNKAEVSRCMSCGSMEFGDEK